MADISRQVTAKWVMRFGERRIHLVAQRGVISTEAYLTEAEAWMVRDQLTTLLTSQNSAASTQERK